jgi:hypothetical protein
MLSFINQTISNCQAINFPVSAKKMSDVYNQRLTWRKQSEPFVTACLDILKTRNHDTGKLLI